MFERIGTGLCLVPLGTDMIQFGASTACLYPTLTEQALEQLGQLGIPLVEIFYNSPSEYENGFLKRLKEILDRYGMRAVSMHPYDSFSEPYMFFTGYERRFLDQLDQYRRYFEKMHLVGSDIFVFHGDRHESLLPEEKYFERFAALSEAGKRCGVIVAQENVERCKSRDPRFIRAMRNYLRKEAHFVLDLKQAVRGGYSPFEMLEAMGEGLVHLHLNDHTPDRDCLLPGRGGFDFSSFFCAVTQKGYQGAALIEVYRQNFGELSELADSFCFLKDQLKRIEI